MRDRRTAHGGWTPGGGGSGFAGEFAVHNPTAASPQGLSFRRLTERLHANGPRPVGEAIAFALRRLDPDGRAELLGQLEVIASFTPEQVDALGARDWPTPPLVAIAGGAR